MQNSQITLNTTNTALVLEGGGMRSVFTAGVLDFFMDFGIKFPYMIGVSGGASNGVSYKSNQRGRSHYANIILMKKYKYIGLKPLLTKGRIIDIDYLFKEFAYQVYPFDFNAFFADKSRFEIVTTNCITGEAHYIEETKQADHLLKIIQASCCLPLINPPLNIDSIPMIDGGMADSIPLARAFEQGYEKAIVVLTQNKGYRKKVSRFSLPSFLFRQYPKIGEMLQTRPQRYNSQLEWIEQLEVTGKISVLRPESPTEVGRLTSNTDKLQRLYDEGYELAKKFCLS